MRYLDLSGTDVTIPFIKSMSKLDKLMLTAGQCTDATIEQLKRTRARRGERSVRGDADNGRMCLFCVALTRLRVLDISGTDVTIEGVRSVIASTKFFFSGATITYSNM